MVFSSIPVYLDPSNWHQQQNHHLPLGGTTAAPGSEISHELPPLPAPPTLSHVGLGSGGVGIGQNSIRPNSMSDRARMAKIPQPETALKCPRCESTNTKFCYFNNYSLSQPRHFCKTCRRYWTRGGALRNVPVGGGCRRNKKSKSGNNNNNSGSSSGRSKSPAATATEHNQTGSNLMTNNSSDHHLSQLPPLASSIQGLGRYGGGGSMGLNFNEIHHGQPSDHQQHHHMGFQFHQIGGNNSMNNFNGGMLGGFQQLPFLGGGGGGGGFESSASNGLYPFHQASTDPMAGDNSRVGNDQAHDELAPPVKAEDSHGVRLTRPSLGTVISENNNNNQFWGGNLNAWTDLSGLNSSSTGHLL